MSADAIAQLKAAVADLADEDLPSLLGDDLVELFGLRSQLDAEISRRVRAFDRSQEWALTGARSAAARLQQVCRMTGRDASRAVSVGRQVEQMPAVADAWRSGAVHTEHVCELARARKAARADERFAQFEGGCPTVCVSGRGSHVVR